MPLRPLLASAGALVLLLTGCAATPAAGTGSPSSDTIAVVASTDVWADLVERIGGDAVTVTALIDEPDQDPHEYEASARDQLAVREARLLVQNGGGYDDFMDRLTATAPDLPVVDATTVSGRSTQGEFNEHLWYDLPTARRMAAEIAIRLTRIAPERRAEFDRARDRFVDGVDRLERQADAIRSSAKGKGVAITEPVPLYLLAACGLVNRTPEAFSSAVEEGTDVAPAVLRRQLALLTERRVALLAVNAQTATPTTDRVVDAARAASVPVVVARETLPPGQDYLSWMRSDLDAIEKALV